MMGSGNRKNSMIVIIVATALSLVIHTRKEDEEVNSSGPALGCGGFRGEGFRALCELGASESLI